MLLFPTFRLAQDFGWLLKTVRRYCGALPALKICAAALHRDVPVALSPRATSMAGGLDASLWLLSRYRYEGLEEVLEVNVWHR